MVCANVELTDLTRRAQLASYFKKVSRVFRGVINDPDLGKGGSHSRASPTGTPSFFLTYPWPRAGAPWPDPPMVLRPLHAFLRRIHACWRARTMVTRLTSPQQAEMRLKIVAFSVLHKQKRNWGYAHTWVHNYLALAAHNDQAPAFTAAVNRLVTQKALFHRVIFSALGVKCVPASSWRDATVGE